MNPGNYEGRTRPGRQQTNSRQWGRAALVVAHPGHELRVHGWLEQARPVVFVLTDGSGRTGRSRLPSTERVLLHAGAEAGSIFGRLTDVALYDALLDGATEMFLDLVDELAEGLLRAEINLVAGDAAEGYNPGHEVCRLLVNAAVARVRASAGRRLGNYDFALAGRPDQCPEDLRNRAIWLHLDDAAFARKLAAARAYAELAAEVEALQSREGWEASRVECLRPVLPSRTAKNMPADPPFYERYGREKVALGHYQRVVTYYAHIAPLALALRRQFMGAAP